MVLGCGGYQSSSITVGGHAGSKDRRSPGLDITWPCELASNPFFPLKTQIVQYIERKTTRTNKTEEESKEEEEEKKEEVERKEEEEERKEEP